VDPEAGSVLKAAAAAEAARRFSQPAERLAAARIRRSPLAYRLRARLHWDPDQQILGFYERRSWKVASITSCRIVSPRLTGALESLTGALASTCPAAVDVEWLEDLEGTTAIAALRPAAGGPDEMDDGWVPGREMISGIVDGFHLLTRSGSPRVLWGAAAVTMNLPIALEVPIGSFFQANRHLTPWLFDRVAELAGPRPDPVFDLHAGVGLLAAAARHAPPRELQLVEPYRPAAHAAQRNLPGAHVAIGRTAEAFLDRARNLPRKALVLTDPPRAGMSQTLRHRLVSWHPDRILTVACDPVTWARDTAFLMDHGYQLTHVELVDLFPSTHHVEVLAVLEAG
jgi:23S rRNA (uracil1939-C5)-methyltransferase